MNYQQLIDTYGPVEGKERWIAMSTAQRKLPSGFSVMNKDKARAIQSKGGYAKAEKVRAALKAYKGGKGENKQATSRKDGS